MSLDGRRSRPSGSGPLTVWMAQGQERSSGPRLGVTLRLRLLQAPDRIFPGLRRAGRSGAGWGPGGCRSSDRQAPSGRVTRSLVFAFCWERSFQNQAELVRLGHAHLSPAGRKVSPGSEPSCRGGRVGQVPGSLSEGVLGPHHPSPALREQQAQGR